MHGAGRENKPTTDDTDEHGYERKKRIIPKPTPCVAWVFLTFISVFIRVIRGSKEILSHA
jgi:hypothetical protein